MKQDTLLLQGIELVAVGDESLLKAQKHLQGCAACSGSASLPFGSLLRQVLGTSGMTEYLLSSPMECPNCASPIFEETFVACVACEGKPTAAQAELRYFEPNCEETDVVFVDEPTLTEAQSHISGCQNCADTAEISFDQVLDAVMGCDPATTEYVICHAAKCPNCHHEVMEKTLVRA